MADKKTIQVIIDGKIYVLSGENSESYLHDVADYLNHKIESIRKEMWNYNKLEESVRSLLLQINICDELFRKERKWRRCRSFWIRKKVRATPISTTW